jgi:hypothetical protein
MTILYRNHQWAVTKYGVETIKPEAPYYFEAKRLADLTDYGQGPLYNWPIHMAEKGWVDIEAFIEAFVKALELHAKKYKPPVDNELLARSLAEARRATRWR